MGPRQDVDRTTGSQRKLKGCGEDKGQNVRVGGLEEEQKHGVRQCLASDSGPRLWEASIEAEFAVWKAELTMGKGRTHNGERQGRAGQGRAWEGIDLAAYLLRPRLTVHNPSFLCCGKPHGATISQNTKRHGFWSSQPFQPYLLPLPNSSLHVPVTRFP